MMEEANAVLIILCLGGVGLAYSLYYIVFSISPKEISAEENDEITTVFISLKEQSTQSNTLTKEQIQNLEAQSNKILSGVNSFMLREISYSIIIIGVIACFIQVVSGKPKTFYRMIAFLVGAITNYLSCYISVIFASSSNYRIVYKSFFGLKEAYRTVFIASLVISFCVTSVCILSLTVIILIYKWMLITTFSKIGDYNDFFESIFAFGLGSCVVSLIARLAGGLYAKVANIGGDIFTNKKLKSNEDDNKNPLSIFDKIGDNVGGIAGIATDSFSILAVALCASLYIASTSEELVNSGGYFYPLLIMSCGILVCIFSKIFALIFSRFISTSRSLFYVLIFQMLFSISLMIPCIYYITVNYLPLTYNIGRSGTNSYKEGVTQAQTMICLIIGLGSGLIICLITYYYASNTNSPVLQIFEATKQGSTINIIFGLALGYISTLLPTVIIAFSIFFTYFSLDVFGIVLCAIGMLTTLPVYIAIETSASIVNNSTGLGIMCGINLSPLSNLKKIERICNSFGKCYSFSCSCVVALSLLGTYVMISKLDNIDINTPIIFTSLLFGAMIPYFYAAIILRILGKASIEIIGTMKQKENVILSNQEKENTEDSSIKCEKVMSNISIKKMIFPIILVFIIPVIIGLLLGVKAISGLLLGIILSGMQLGLSSVISGIAWKNCKSLVDEKGIEVTIYEKKEIELRQLQKTLEKKKQGVNITLDDIKFRQEEINEIEKIADHPMRKNTIFIRDKDDKFYKKFIKSSIIGDSIGNALKDLSGPSLLVIIKILPMICILSIHAFTNTSYLIQT